MLWRRRYLGVAMNEGFDVVESHIREDIERDQIGGESDVWRDDWYGDPPASWLAKSCRSVRGSYILLYDRYSLAARLLTFPCTCKDLFAKLENLGDLDRNLEATWGRLLYARKSVAVSIGMNDASARKMNLEADEGPNSKRRRPRAKSIECCLLRGWPLRQPAESLHAASCWAPQQASRARGSSQRCT